MMELMEGWKVLPPKKEVGWALHQDLLMTLQNQNDDDLRQ